MISCASNQRMTLSCLDRNDFDTIVNNQKIALFTLHNGEMEAPPSEAQSPQRCRRAQTCRASFC